MNQNELLKLGKELLKQAEIEEAEIKAKKLLEYILNQSREEFIKNSLLEVSKNQEQKYREKIEMIIQGKPLQYIINNQEFMGLDFYVDENVLIPQPDTEILVEQTIKIAKNIEKSKLNITEKLYNKQSIENMQILDLCTGSGAIAISIAKYIIEDMPKVNAKNNIDANIGLCKIQIIASDISYKALEVAKKNSIKNQVESNIQFIQSDMFYKLKNYKFDIIVSNPPYIETKVIPDLSKEVQQEPLLALDGGKDGLDFYKIILKEAPNYLKDNGYVLFEIGYDQGKKIIDLWKKLKDDKECGLELITKEAIKDLSNNDRVMIFQKM